MKKNERNGQRQTRDSRKRRLPSLGYYLIFTDAKETEANYIEGLKQALPETIRNNIVIKVKKTSTANLIKSCLEEKSIDPQFRETWIVFDRDKVPDFDGIISEAQNHSINVAWSNPCIEVWFSAYFGEMLKCENSTKCLDLFKNLFQQKTGLPYKKNDTKIYSKLNNYGKEEVAISRADRLFKSYSQLNKDCKPSEMCPSTTVYLLVKAIRNQHEQLHTHKP